MFASLKATYDSYRSLTVSGRAFYYVLRASGIIFLSSYNSPGQYGLFDIQNIKIVLGHLFRGVDGHIIRS